MKKHTALKIKKAIRAVREKYQITGKFTKKDFYRICRGEDIKVVKSDEMAKIKSIKGFIVKLRRDGSLIDFIYLRCLSFANFDHFTALHELGHYFLGHQGYKLRVDSEIWNTDTVHEAEADMFAELFNQGGEK